MASSISNGSVITFFPFFFLFAASKVISLVSRTTFITREDLNIRSKMSNRIKLRFKTRDKVGILVTVGKAHDYMTLEIYKGYLRLSIDVGGGE